MEAIYTTSIVPNASLFTGRSGDILHVATEFGMPNAERWLIRVKNKAKEKGITNEDIAHHFEMTPGQVSHWFTGRRKIWLDQYIELCRFVLEDPVKMLADNPDDAASKIAHQQSQIIDRLDKILDAHPELSPHHGQLVKTLRKVTRKRQAARKMVKKHRVRTA
jgi:transcriptional regulator with XRE-family HTH domain